MLGTNQKKQLFEEGKSAFNNKGFFAAHEIWEEIWQDLRINNSDSLELFQLQGLIQIAVTLHLVQESRLVGAKKVLERANLNISSSEPIYNNINLSDLYSKVSKLLEDPADLSLVPKLK